MSKIESHPLIFKALKQLLRPLVSLLLKRGITLPMLYEQLRQTYVDLASETLEGKKSTNVSAVSLATGIHRKEVKRLLNKDNDNEVESTTASLGARLVGIWMGDPEYQDDRGTPLPLPKTSREPNQVSFESLVESVNRDVRPRAVLDDWLRLGLVRLDENGYIVIEQQAFIPAQGEEEKLHFFGRNLHDHIASGCHNILEEGEPLLDRAVFYDGLTQSSLQKLQELAQQQGLEVLQQINQEALSLANQDDQIEEDKGRMRFGVYYYQEAPRYQEAPQYQEQSDSMQGKDNHS